MIEGILDADFSVKHHWNLSQKLLELDSKNKLHQIISKTLIADIDHLAEFQKAEVRPLDSLLFEWLIGNDSFRMNHATSFNSPTRFCLEKPWILGSILRKLLLTLRKSRKRAENSHDFEEKRPCKTIHERSKIFDCSKLLWLSFL